MPTPRRTRRSVRRTSPWPASRCTRTADNYLRKTEEAMQPMAYAVAMPALGESVTEGTVTRWLKNEGDTVEVDEPLVEVSTDKVDTEIPSPAAGGLQRTVVHADETVEVGAELAVISDPAAAPKSTPAELPQPGSRLPSAQPPPRPAAPPPPSTGSGTAVTMPALGESVTAGTVTRWLKQVG